MRVQAFDAADRTAAPAESGGGPCRDGLPEFAADFDLAGGVEQGCGRWRCADHGLGAGEDFAAAGRRAIHARPKEMVPKPRPAPIAVAGWTRSSGIGPSTSVARPKTSEMMPASASTPWLPNLASRSISTKAARRRSDGGMADGQEVEAEEAEEDEEGADGARNDGAGDVELQVDEKAAKDEEEDGDVGVGEFAEKALAQRGRVVRIRARGGAGSGGAVKAVDFAAVEGGEQGGVVGGDRCR